jgi:MoaA/NifB/PqqE/SkfB family radical SAM enzyme
MRANPTEPILRFARDVRNLVQAFVAVRSKRVYMPSLFGHYTVNSVCNLRCSYCYVGQPEIFPQGFANPGLPLNRAKQVLSKLRQECLFLRFLGGEPTLYQGIAELARYAKEDLHYWHTSLITNGLLLARHPERYASLLEALDHITISIDRTRLDQYPREMARLERSLPVLLEHCRRHRVALTGNYTATWDELAHPEWIERAVERFSPYFASTYIMPVRLAGKTPLPLLKNSLALNRRHSVSGWEGFGYPETEEVQWYREHCDPKLKIKIDADGCLVYPCENHSYAAGSLESHTIRELWLGQPVQYPNESCMGCGKQRFRSHAMKHLGASLGIVRHIRRVGASASARHVHRVKLSELEGDSH